VCLHNLAYKQKVLSSCLFKPFQGALNGTLLASQEVPTIAVALFLHLIWEIIINKMHSVVKKKPT
jgi:hypothetical protein